MGVIIKFEDANDDTTLETYLTDDNLIGLTVECNTEWLHIHLDIETAVKFSKELRKVIAESKEINENEQ